MINMFFHCILIYFMVKFTVSSNIKKSESMIENEELSLKRRLVINAHNEYRKRHFAQPLQEDENMNNYAQQWVEHCTSTHYLLQRPQSRYSENRWTNPNMSLKNLMFSNEGNPVYFWYNQIDKYKATYIKKEYEEWNGFSFVVWRESAKIGIGIAEYSVSVDKPGGVFVVCYYHPDGNIKQNDTNFITQSRLSENVIIHSGKNLPITILDYICFGILLLTLLFACYLKFILNYVFQKYEL